MAFITKCMVLLCALVLVANAGTTIEQKYMEKQPPQKNKHENKKQHNNKHHGKHKHEIQHHENNKHDNKHQDKQQHRKKHHDKSQENHAQKQPMEKKHEGANHVEMTKHHHTHSKTMSMIEEPTCAEIVATVAEAFPYQAEILTSIGLIDAFAKFRGTLVLPTEDALTAAVPALGLDLEKKEDVALLKEVISYHAMPDIVVYSGAATPSYIRVNTLLSEDSILTSVCEDKGLEFSTTLRFGKDFTIVQSGGVTANIGTPDIELCGPTVVHTIDAVLLPCALLS